MFKFLHTFQPQSILLEIGWLKIYWYGFLIAVGIVLAFLVILYLAKQYKLAKDHVYNLAFYLIIFGLIGDRLYYVIYAWDYYSHNLLDIFKIWQGGLAIHGAMIAGLLVLYIYGKKHDLRFGFLADLFLIGLPLAMFFGRFGNYFNMELFGLPTDLPWGIPITELKRPIQYLTATHFHPTFLYESLWNLIVFIILFAWHKLRLNKYKNPDKIQGLGNIALTYFILYSLGRFLNEFLRLDYSPYFLGLRWAQFISLIIIITCLIIIIARKYYKSKTAPVD
ncbi:MAG: prolipoprotein diacylglyceryl transferase [Candidatus Buchananbacteria bacterium]|nr:prolipoprotein diacylglyceryl transferase [Candidatus Buchananbacteria bacterium]